MFVFKSCMLGLFSASELIAMLAVKWVYERGRGRGRKRERESNKESERGREKEGVCVIVFV